VRGVSRLDIRLKEAAKLGFKRAVLYKNDFKSFDFNPELELIGVNSVADLLEWLAS